MEKRRVHLQSLPGGILKELKKEALKTWNSKELADLMEAPCAKSSALKQLFVFSGTEKGHRYWWGIYEKYLV